MSSFNLQVSPYLQINNISHRYDQKLALKDVCLNVAQSEILALLGPSGSGKSTLLAAIAGIVQPDKGEIVLGGRKLLDLAPEARGLGMVFQDYALWPHMTVAQNVAFPLRARKYPSRAINDGVGEALRRVGLQGFEPRRTQQLSGGQQQRVALARAIAAETELLLLDEPLSALDPATRSSVRAELADILRQLNLTTIIVTHDREEAFELADRIAVLVEGEIQQHAECQDIYERPVNITVARFMGVNLLSLEALPDDQAQLSQRLQQVRAADPAAHLAIPPERTWITNDPAGLINVVRGRLIKSQYRGGEYRLQVNVGTDGAGQIIEARSKTAPVEQSLYVHLPDESIHVISRATPDAKGIETKQPSATQAFARLEEEIA
jgi:ABC-type Fe3+/spermidine/putrescine transport system ATPase subunit